MSGVEKVESLREDRFPGNVSAYHELQKSILDGAILAFTGAGVSAPLFPTWSKLLEALTKEAANQGLIRPEEIGDYLSQILSDPLELASALEDVYTKQVFRSRFANVFSNQDGQCNRSHELIDDLRLRGIATLNYDSGHQVAYARRGRHPNVGRSRDEATLTSWLQGSAFDGSDIPILHLHGDPSDPNEMILTGDDYYRHYQKQLPRDLITHLWRSERLLAIGFGFSDPFLTKIAEGTLSPDFPDELFCWTLSPPILS